MAHVPEEKLKVPYCTELPDGLDQGKLVRIRGSVPKDGKSFVVSFLCGKEEDADALLFLIKLDDSSEMALKCFLNKILNEEEKYSNLPFAKGQDFQLEFIFEEEGFKVVANEEETYQYKQHIPAEKIHFLQVEGNVELEFVSLLDEKDSQPGDKMQSPGMLHCPRRCRPVLCCRPCRPCVRWYCYRCYCVPCRCGCRRY
ncbi:galectin-7-like [Anolis sagrei]|uniref:galectin-7-like n=1 Tax=Anolis sagrei TaxID=38937 RepID=UPI0035226E5D